MAAPATLRRRSRADDGSVLVLPQFDVAAALERHTRQLPAWKRAFDIIAASLALVVLTPLLLIVAAVVSLDSPGGPIFRQVRVGKGGRTFVCWKFRTMQRGADAMKAQLMTLNEANGHIFKMRNDPRRTRVGVFLRKTSIDELPQLWNVLKGEMSIIGPRPPVPAEVANYEPAQLRRLAVEPGITGLWQVTLRGRHDFEDMVAKDVEYAERRSPGLDAWILLKTVAAVVRGDGSC